MKKSYMAWFCAILMLSSVFVVGIQVNKNAEAIVVEGDGILYTPHAPIRIDSDADFPGITSAGDGSVGNPWIIENWDINGTGYGYCIYVGNATDYFIVQDCYLHESTGGGSYPYTYNSGLIMYNVTNGLIMNNSVSWASENGIYILECYETNITQNLLFDNMYGLWADESAYINITENTALNASQTGIGLGDSSHVLIMKNDVTQNMIGMYLVGGSNNTVRNNEIYDNDRYGISLYGYTGHESYDSNVISNNITSSGKAISIYSSHRNIIKFNNCTYSGSGVQISSSHDNNITANNISDNIWGIQFYDSNNNLLHHNNFERNTDQIELQDSVNIWDDGLGEGNYWDDYQGNDYGENGRTAFDGIGDSETPHPFIDQGNGYFQIDNYPLMNPITGIPNTLYVDDDGTADYTIIQDAVDAAIPGMSIFVYNGSYDENVNVYKSLTLRGEDPNSVMIDGVGGPVLTITSNWVNLTGFSILNGGSNDGLILDNVQNCFIIRNNCSQNMNGLYLNNSDNNSIIENWVSMNEVGAVTNSSNDNIFTGNTIFENFNGIILYGSNSNNLTENNVSNNMYSGLILNNSYSNNLTKNNVSENTQTGIVLNNSGNNTLYHNYVSNNQNAGISFDNSNNHTIIVNYIWANGEGLRLDSSENNNIHHNNLIGNTVQIYSPDLSSYNNIWNDTEGKGNHWGDYGGIDDGSSGRINLDGVGDTEIPHPFIDQGNGYFQLDNYPLMEIYTGGPRTLYVDDDGNVEYTVIQNAINDARPRDTVFVFNGTYPEQLIIDKSISLIGEDWDNTKIEWTISSMPAWIKADWINFTGFYITDASDFGSAVMIDKADHVNFSHNKINIVDWRAIQMVFADNCTIDDNVLIDTGTYGISLDNSYDNSICRNYMSNAGGNPISLYISDRNIMENNTIVGISQGIGLNIADYNRVMNNDITGVDNAITLLNSDYNTVSFNNCTENQDGIEIGDSEYNIISNNNASSNDNYGITLSGNSFYNIVENNTIIDNVVYGIESSSADHNTMSNNTILRNRIGIHFSGSSQNTIIWNEISKNEQYGIWMWDSYANVFHHNNIVNNTVQMRNNNLDNSIWDDGAGQGNYWSDYSGVDDGSSGRFANDGIGDTQIPHPYIDQGDGYYQLDNYPLMMPKEIPILEYTMQLVEGWNFISIPLEQTHTNISSVLNFITGQYDVIKYYDTTDANDPWKTYRPGASTNDLMNLDHRMGFWAHMLNFANVTINGFMPASTSINLYAGWNLVGYPSLTPKTVADALLGTGADRIEICDLAEPYLIKEVASTYVMQSGEGYWVHVPADTVWTVDW